MIETKTKYTLEDISSMKIQELENLLNSLVKDLSYTSIDRTYVRDAMFERIKQSFDPAVEMRSTMGDGSSISMRYKRIGITISVSTKGTGEIRQVSKLKSKYVAAPGKFKIKYVSSGYSLPSFEFEHKNKSLLDKIFEKEKTDKFKVKKTEWHHSGGSIEFDKYDWTFAEMNKPENFLKAIEDTYPKKDKLSLIDDINSDGVQPLLNRTFMDRYWLTNFLGNMDKIHKLFPEHKAQLKKDPESFFDIARAATMESNKELYLEIIKDIANGTESYRLGNDE